MLAVDDLTVRAWAELRAMAAAKGLPKQIGDLWIAATAKRHDIPLLTRDAGFFQGIDITIIRPEDEPGA